MTDNDRLIESLRALLMDAPPPEQLGRKTTKGDVVKTLKAEIRSLLRRGYTLKMVSEVLRSGGLKIAPQTLSQNLRTRSAPSGERLARESASRKQPKESQVKLRGSSKKGTRKAATTTSDSTTFSPREDSEDL